MHRYLPFILLTLIVWLFLCCGCSNTRLHPGLSEAKALVEEDTDSCLVVLESIDSAELKTPYDRAFYNLMMLRALDKSHFPITRLSAEANDAVEYFDAHGDTYTRMLSHFCRGRLYHNMEDYNHAIIDISEAFDLAEQSADWFWMGMSARSISDIFNATFNSAEELHWSQKELEYFEKSGKTDYRNYAILDLVLAYHQDCQYRKAIQLIPELQRIANDTGDDNLEYETLVAHGLLLLGMDDYIKADSVFETVCNLPYATYQDSVFWAMALIGTQKYNKAGDIIAGYDDNNDYKLLSIRADLLKNKGNLHDVVRIHETMDSLINLQIHNQVNQFVIGSFMSYYDNYINTQALESKNLILQKWIILAVCIALISYLVSVVIILRQRNKRERERNFLLAKSLSEKPVMNHEESVVTDVNNIDAIKMFTERFRHLNSVLSSIYENNSIDIAIRKSSDEIRSAISSFKNSDKLFSKLSTEIDSQCNNLCSRFRIAFPNISENDYKLFVLSITGFSNPAIAVILGSDDSLKISKQRYRLKEKIRRSPSDNTDEFLNALDKGKKRNN